MSPFRRAHGNRHPLAVAPSRLSSKVSDQPEGLSDVEWCSELTNAIYAVARRLVVGIGLFLCGTSFARAAGGEGADAPPKHTDSVLLVLVGAVAAIGSAAGTGAMKEYLNRRNSVRAETEAIRKTLLIPLQSAASDLAKKLKHIDGELSVARTQVNGERVPERDMPDDQLRHDYSLRWWFRWCKDVVVNPNNDEWPDTKRIAELSMHAGGEGYDAASSLFLMARYLCLAARMRATQPFIRFRSGSPGPGEALQEVRSALAALEFYDVTQDSTGDTVRDTDGMPVGFREFLMRMCDSKTRGWFLTLTDVHFKLHGKSRKQVQELASNLERLEEALSSTVITVATSHPRTARPL